MKTESERKIEHSPLPWIMTENGANGYITVEGPGSVVVHQSDLGSIPDEATGKDALAAELYGNAAFIVQACNAHDALVEALREMVELWNDLGRSNPGFMSKLTLQDYQRFNEAPMNARAALRLAGKKGE